MQSAISKARTIPSYFYTCPNHFRKEMEAVFLRNNWIHVGRLNQVANIGDYFSGKIDRQPFVVTRTDLASCKAFDNVCRHHGTILAKGGGHFANERITCCYHGWTYSLDGKLIRATRLKGIEDFRARDYGLHHLQMKTLGELVFLNFTKQNDANGTSIDEKFVHVDVDFADLQFVKTRTYRLNCNWKVFVDNYLDGGYHVKTVHPGLAGVIDYASYRTEIDQHASVQISPLRQAKRTRSARCEPETPITGGSSPT